MVLVATAAVSKTIVVAFNDDGRDEDRVEGLTEMFRNALRFSRSAKCYQYLLYGRRRLR